MPYMALLTTQCVCMTSSDVDICTTETYPSVKPISEKMSDSAKTPGDKTTYARSISSLFYSVRRIVPKTECVASSQMEKKV